MMIIMVSLFHANLYISKSLVESDGYVMKLCERARVKYKKFEDRLHPFLTPVQITLSDARVKQFEKCKPLLIKCSTGEFYETLRNSFNSYTNGAFAMTSLFSIICAVLIVVENILNESC